VNLVEIERDRVTIELDPRDCYWLAESCVAAGAYFAGSEVAAHHFGFASEGEMNPATGERRGLWYETLAVALQAAAVAGEAEHLAGPGGPPTLDYVRRRYAGKGEQFPPTPGEEKRSTEGPPAA